MSVCPDCGAEVQPGERFCKACGCSLATTPQGSCSRVEIEPALLNSVLALYANKPGVEVRFEGGHLQAQVGEHSVTINPIRLNEVAQVLVGAGPLGKLNLSVDLVHLGERGLEIQLRLA